MSVTTALLIGAYGTYKVSDTFFEQERYPLRVEYEIVDACVNSSARALLSKSYVKKKEICLCALEATSRTVSYREMQNDPAVFTSAFKNNASSCN